MSNGIAFVDILVSEITMISALLLFIFCAGVLLFKRKDVTPSRLKLAAVGLVLTGVYLAFILFMVFMWG